jgi:deferrochelatase/peroxidase EfeB
VTALAPGDVQGNILRSYGRHYGFVRHLVLTVQDPVRARQALGDMATGDRATPEVTTAEQVPRRERLDWCLNLGITYRGLAALGVPEVSLRSFPTEFRQGMVARAGWLGDVGDSAPANWVGGLHDPARAHLLVSIHGHRPQDLEEISESVRRAGGGEAFAADPGLLDGAMFTGDHEGQVHFGYQDGLSNVRFQGVHDQSDGSAPLAPLGAALLGHPSPLPHVEWRVPWPRPLGLNGSFSAFRVLRQDVAGFEDFLHHAAAAAGCGVEEVAAKMCGRWRNGAPLVTAPTETEAERLPDPSDSHFGFAEDPDGARCPLGSHIRRSNPRDALLVQRGTNYTRPLVRRGMPYGPPYQPGAGADGVARGLLGNFLCASLGAQFEAVQFDWLNLGLQDPRITGTNDPLVGANDPASARFEWTTSTGDKAVVGGLQRFVRTEGGAYCFLPSLTAIRWIASGAWAGEKALRARRLFARTPRWRAERHGRASRRC